MQVDFLVVSRKGDGTLGVSTIDPHDDHLADARAKLVALCDYAEHHGNAFVRIESIARSADGTLQVLDLQSAPVRAAIRAFEGAQVSTLYESGSSRPYL